MQNIIQWNCRGLKANLNDLLLLITNYQPMVICLQETSLKANDKIKIKDYSQYNYIHEAQQRASGGVSILIRNDIPQSKIPLETKLQAVAVKATLHRTLNICSIYIPPHEPIEETTLNKLIEQLPRPFLLLGDFNSHNIIWGSKNTNKKGKNLENVINNLCLLNDKSNTYLHPAFGIYSAIDLSLCDPVIFMDYNWKVLDDSWGSDHYPIILNTSEAMEIHLPRWKLNKVDWNEYKIISGRPAIVRKIRKEEVVLTRLRIGHTYITHQHILKNEESPICVPCQEVCTVKHILINCHYLRQIRSKHYKSDNLKDLFENNNPSKIINFIKEIGIVRKI